MSKMLETGCCRVSTTWLSDGAAAVTILPLCLTWLGTPSFWRKAIAASTSAEVNLAPLWNSTSVRSSSVRVFWSSDIFQELASEGLGSKVLGSYSVRELKTTRMMDRLGLFCAIMEPVWKSEL